MSLRIRDLSLSLTKNRRSLVDGSIEKEPELTEEESYMQKRKYLVQCRFITPIRGVSALSVPVTDRTPIIEIKCKLLEQLHELPEPIRPPDSVLAVHGSRYFQRKTIQNDFKVSITTDPEQLIFFLDDRDDALNDHITFYDLGFETSPPLISVFCATDHVWLRLRGFPERFSVPWHLHMTECELAKEVYGLLKPRDMRLVRAVFYKDDEALKMHRKYRRPATDAPPMWKPGGHFGRYETEDSVVVSSSSSSKKSQSRKILQPIVIPLHEWCQIPPPPNTKIDPALIVEEIRKEAARVRSQMINEAFIQARDSWFEVPQDILDLAEPDGALKHIPKWIHFTRKRDGRNFSFRVECPKVRVRRNLLEEGEDNDDDEQEEQGEDANNVNDNENENNYSSAYSKMKIETNVPIGNLAESVVEFCASATNQTGAYAKRVGANRTKSTVQTEDELEEVEEEEENSSHRTRKTQNKKNSNNNNDHVGEIDCDDAVTIDAVSNNNTIKNFFREHDTITNVSTSAKGNRSATAEVELFLRRKRMLENTTMDRNHPDYDTQRDEEQYYSHASKNTDDDGDAEKKRNTQKQNAGQRGPFSHRRDGNDDDQQQEDENSLETQLLCWVPHVVATGNILSNGKEERVPHTHPQLFLPFDDDDEEVSPFGCKEIHTLWSSKDIIDEKYSLLSPDFFFHQRRAKATVAQVAELLKKEVLSFLREPLKFSFNAPASANAATTTRARHEAENPVVEFDNVSLPRHLSDYGVYNGAEIFIEHFSIHVQSWSNDVAKEVHDSMKQRLLKTRMEREAGIFTGKDIFFSTSFDVLESNQRDDEFEQNEEEKEQERNLHSISTNQKTNILSGIQFSKPTTKIQNQANAKKNIENNNQSNLLHDEMAQQENMKQLRRKKAMQLQLSVRQRERTVKQAGFSFINVRSARGMLFRVAVIYEAATVQDVLELIFCATGDIPMFSIVVGPQGELLAPWTHLKEIERHPGLLSLRILRRPRAWRDENIETVARDASRLAPHLD